MATPNKIATTNRVVYFKESLPATDVLLREMGRRSDALQVEITLPVTYSVVNELFTVPEHTVMYATHDTCPSPRRTCVFLRGWGTHMLWNRACLWT